MLWLKFKAIVPFVLALNYRFYISVSILLLIKLIQSLDIGIYIHQDSVELLTPEAYNTVKDVTWNVLRK